MIFLVRLLSVGFGGMIHRCVAEMSQKQIQDRIKTGRTQKVNSVTRQYAQDAVSICGDIRKESDVMYSKTYLLPHKRKLQKRVCKNMPLISSDIKAKERQIRAIATCKGSACSLNVYAHGDIGGLLASCPVLCIQQESVVCKACKKNITLLI